MCIRDRTQCAPPFIRLPLSLSRAPLALPSSLAHSAAAPAALLSEPLTPRTATSAQRQRREARRGRRGRTRRDGMRRRARRERGER
eukprot:957926-Rhodomonas_salina.1